MSKIGSYVLGALFFVGLVGAMSVTAQESAPGENFVRNISLEQVLRHPNGYKIIYVKDNFEVASAYLPARWFYEIQPEGRIGRIQLTTSTSAPYLQAHYKEGDFTYLQLVLPKNPAHFSFGPLKEDDARATFEEATPQTLILE